MNTKILLLLFTAFFFSVGEGKNNPIDYNSPEISTQSSISVDCDEFKKELVAQLELFTSQIILLQESVIYSLIANVNAKKIAQLSKNKSDNELLDYFKKCFEKSKYVGILKEFYTLRTSVASANIPIKNFSCIDGKLFIRKVSMEKHTTREAIRTDFSVIIDGNSLKMLSNIPLESKTGYVLQIADIAKDKRVGIKYILINEANELFEFSSLEEFAESLLPEECKTKDTAIFDSK
jgi:hypothetical protein